MIINPYALGAGNTAGQWDPSDVVMGIGSPDFTYANANAEISNPFFSLTNPKGTGRSLTHKTSGMRYVELVLNLWGGFPSLGLAWGFSSTPDGYTYNWNDNGNKNATWHPSDGAVYSHGQTNNGSSGLSLLFGANDVYRMGIEVGVGLTWFAINGGTPVDVSGLVPFTEADVKVFACLGTGASGDGGSDAAITILTTGATQVYSPFSSHTPWDD